MNATGSRVRPQGPSRLRWLSVLATALLALGFAAPTRADPGGNGPNVEYPCSNHIGTCIGPLPPPFPSAGTCTRYLRAWHFGDQSREDDVDVCIEFMGINKYCADRNAYVTVGYVDAPGTWNGDLRVLQCTVRHHDDDVLEQLVRIGTGVGEGLITAAPFVAEAVAGLACVYGQLYACAVIALDLTTQAGLVVPGEVGEALAVAVQVPQCLDGDVVACAKLGVHGANIVGLDIPGFDKVLLGEDVAKCASDDFAACMRVGQAASEASGVDLGKAVGIFGNAQDCADGKDAACIELGKEAVQGTPLKGVPQAYEDARACKAGVTQRCYSFGQNIASTANGLTAASAAPSPFGANACISAPMAPGKGPVDLAGVWDDRSATSIAVFPSSGQRFGAPYQASRRVGGWADTAKLAAADFDGDGMSDILAIWNDGERNTFTLRQSTPTRGMVAAHWAVRSGGWSNRSVWLPGDFNGDGHMDVAGAWNDGGLTSIAVYLGDGHRFAAPTQWSLRDGGWGANVKWAVGDFNGDGKDDVVAAWDDAGSNTLTVRSSNGAHFSQAHWAVRSGGWIDGSVWLAGDYNGDGKLDLAVAWHDGDATTIGVYASDGSRFGAPAAWSQRDGGWVEQAKWTSGDFDGDGKTDLADAWEYQGQNVLTVRRSSGSGFSSAHWANKVGGWSPSAAWCTGTFPHSAFGGAGNFRELQTHRRSAIGAAAVANAKPPVLLGRAAPRAPAGGPLPSLCDAARSARARNSPAAPSLERQCTASGGSFAPLPPLDGARIEALAAVGVAIADRDAAVAQARLLEPDPGYQRGFDIASGLFGDPALGAQGNTLMGPGSARIRDSLDAAGQRGFNASVAFHTARKYTP